MNIYFQAPTAPDFAVGRIFIKQEDGKERYNLNLGADGRIEKTLLPDYCATEIKPFLALPEDLFFELITAAAEYAKKREMIIPSETFHKGKLEATEKHLQDLATYFEMTLKKLTQP